MTRFESRRFVAEEDLARLSEVEDKLYKIVVPELEEQRINPQDFADLYGAGVVQEDIRRTKVKRKEIESQSKADPVHEKSTKRGHLFEAIIADQVNQRSWFGEKSSIVVSSEYDDYWKRYR